jgi:hypothetical protein
MGALIELTDRQECSGIQEPDAIVCPLQLLPSPHLDPKTFELRALSAPSGIAVSSTLVVVSGLIKRLIRAFNQLIRTETRTNKGFRNANAQLEGCESGRIGRSRKPLCRKAPWVRIPLPPPMGCLGTSETDFRDRCIMRSETTRYCRSRLWLIVPCCLEGEPAKRSASPSLHACCISQVQRFQCVSSPQAVAWGAPVIPLWLAGENGRAP